MNVLKEALASIATLIPNQEVIIETHDISIVKGVPHITKSEFKHIAHIQPIRSQMHMVEGTIASNDNHMIWILGDNLQIIYEKLVKNKESFVIWGNKRLKILAKHDFSLNGWIEVEATHV